MFEFSGERFADIQMLRYRLNGFEALSLQQKLYIYHLSEATLWGRDITFDQFGRYNLRIRKLLETVYTQCKDTHTEPEFQALATYLKRVWFSNGIYHHYGCEKFKPEFTEEYFRNIVKEAYEKIAENSKDGANDEDVPANNYDCHTNVEEYQTLQNEVCPVIFDETLLPKRVNKADGEDLIKTSACNYYEGVTQEEVEEYYAKKNDPSNPEPPSYGLNSTLCKTEDGELHEIVWHKDGKYGKTIEHITEHLLRAKEYAENDTQRKVIDLLVDYYTTGDLHTFDLYSIEWLKETEGMVDFINGFIEVYGDPLGIKASWEGIVEYKDLEACERTQKICRNAQWFEDHSPVAAVFKKKEVKGVTANVICAAMLGGDEYPSTAIGINLPNADWIRAQYGSKSVTISNLTQAYDEASKGNGFLDEFACDKDVVAMVRKYGDKCDDLHTDLHECLGHGSGQLLPGVDPNALKNYSSTIEEARADLFGLYYIADDKMMELGLLESPEAYKSQYYTYMMNGLLTQSVRIKLGDNIEEAHMRNRALIANWVLEKCKEAQAKDGESIMELKYCDGESNKEHNGNKGKTHLFIYNYARIREIIGELLAEVQRIKSEGDLEAARSLVENYGVKLDYDLHKEILSRYERLNIAPYKGFLNPRYEIVLDDCQHPVDVIPHYDETLEEQMMRYSRDYSVE